MAKWKDTYGVTNTSEVSYDKGDLISIDDVGLFLITDEVSISAMVMDEKDKNFHRKVTFHDVTGYRIHSCDSDSFYDAVFVPSIDYYDGSDGELMLDAKFAIIFDEKHIGEDGFVLFGDISELYPTTKENIDKARENAMNLERGLVPKGGKDEDNYKLLLEHIIMKAKADSYNHYRHTNEVTNLTGGEQ